MELLILSLVFSMIVSNTVALPSRSNDNRQRDEFDSDGAESFLQTLTTLPLENNVPEELLNLAELPHEALHQFSSYIPPATGYGPPVPAVPLPTYGAPIPVPPPVGISIDKHVVLSPQIEVFRFLEAFLHFKTELIARLQHLINDNWDLIRSIINLVLGNVQKLQGFTLSFISILRQMLEFAIGLFSQLSVNIPSVSVGVTGQVHPVPTFNVQSLISAASGWLNG